MSLLLDALKRSEQEREQTLQGRLSHVGPEPHATSVRTPWAVIVAILLCVNIGLIAVWLNATRQPAPTPSAETPVSALQVPRHQVRSLAQEAALGAGAAATSAQAAAPAPADRAPTAAPDDSVASPEDAPPLDTLPQAVQHELPELHMQIHVYAADPAQRFVMIGMHRYVEGDTLAAGPRVMQITPEGVVLQYRGRAFLLPVRR